MVVHIIRSVDTRDIWGVFSDRIEAEEYVSKELSDKDERFIVQMWEVDGAIL